MASVWIHDRQRLKKLRGHLSVLEAMSYFEKMLKNWRAEGGVTRRVDAMEALLLRSDGKVMGGMYIEAISPPSAVEPGQPKREKA